MKRKEFVNKLGATALLTSLGVSLDSCTYDSEGSLDPDNPTPALATFSITSGVFTALANDDGWLLHPSEDILLVNVGGNINAFSSVCPHQACTRDWEYASAQFTCKCHLSVFDTAGERVSGPANVPLTKLTVSQENDMITITR